MPKTAAPLLMIVDGNAILHRAFHALPPLTAPDGRVVHAAYGFFAVFFKALVDLHPTHVAVTFDRPEETFRKKLFAAYQAQREEQPDDLYAQIPIIKDVLAALRVPVYEAAGFEADDVIGTITSKVRGKRAEVRVGGRRGAPRVIILTGDKDLLQLVGDGVEVVLLRRGMTDTVRYDTAAVIERFGFPPERMVDYKALAGDPSDNYPGVPGVGEKTATELVKAFGGVADILKNAKCKMQNAKLSQPLTEKLAQKLCDHAKGAELGLKLSTILRDVPIEFRIEECARGAYDRDAVVATLRELGFTSLVGRLPIPSPTSLPELRGTSRSLSPGDGEKKSIFPPSRRSASDGSAVGGEGGRGAETLTNQPAIRQAIADARAAGALALAVVADGDDPRRGHPRALGIAFPVTTESANGSESTNVRVVGMAPWGAALSESAAMLRDAAITKDTHDAKALLHALRRSRIDLAGLRDDTELLHYLLAPGSRSHDLARVAFTELGMEIGQQGSRAAGQQGIVAEGFSPPRGGLSAFGGSVGGGKAAATPGGQVSGVNGQVSPAAAERAGREAAIVQRLVPILRTKVADAGLTRVYEDIDRPLIPILQRMEETGVRLDADHLAALGMRMHRELDAADRTITELAGEAFNIDSPIQLKRILFEKLGIAVRGIKKTAKGRTLSTAAAELEKLRGSHPIIEHLFTHRELQKLLSTYVEALPQLVDATTGRLHTTFHQTVTATGRLSSSDPNLQNIPVSEPWGPAIRRAFIAEDGWQLLALDYSQFELRIAAALSGDRALTAAFRTGRDIHAATGAEVFGVAPEAVTRDQRRVAKAINFGILYGMGAGALATSANITRPEAEEYIARYFQAYAELAEWVAITKALAAKRGYVETLFGRKRFLPELASHVPQVHAAAERMAVNMPIQGTQADLLKMAMIRADEWIHSSSSSRGGPVRRGISHDAHAVRMVLTVHDELVFEVRDDAVVEATAALTDILEHVHNLPVPIVVEAKAGRNWGEMRWVNA